jgi:hypothetical protein
MLAGTPAAIATDWDHEVYVLNGGETQHCDQAMAFRKPTHTARFHAVLPESSFYGMPNMRTPLRLAAQLAVFECIAPALEPATTPTYTTDLVLYRIKGAAPNADMRILAE